jgi:hypothetical protein
MTWRVSITEIWLCVIGWLGFLLVFGVLAILSVGAPLFVLGVLLLGVLVGCGLRRPDSLGLFAGAGTVCLVIALIGAVAGAAWWAVIGLPGSAVAQSGGGAADP